MPELPSFADLAAEADPPVDLLALAIDPLRDAMHRELQALRANLN